MGRTSRLATTAQTKALVARDGGCSFPGCQHPPEWCERHHIVAWVDGGPTDLDNLTLLCRFHHHQFFDPRLDVPDDRRPTRLDPTPLDRPAAARPGQRPDRGTPPPLLRAPSPHHYSDRLPGEATARQHRSDQRQAAILR